MKNNSCFRKTRLLRWTARRAAAGMLAAGLWAALAACGGGGGGGSSPPQPPVPPPPAELETTAVIPPLPEPNLATVNFAADPEFLGAGGLDVVNADAAYERGYFGQGVTVAIVDSGVASHPELGDRIAQGRNFADEGMEDSIYDATGHGSFIAGVIAAARDGRRMHGIAPSASILPLQLVRRGLGSGFVPNKEADAFEYGRSRGAAVYNNSYAFEEQITVRLDLPPDFVLRGADGSAAATISIAEEQTRTVRAVIPLMAAEWTARRSFVGLAERIAAAARPAGAVYVWAAGNQFWREGNEQFMVCEAGMNEGDGSGSNRCSDRETAYSMTPEEFLRYGTNLGTGEALSVSGMTVNSAGFYAEIPSRQGFADLQGSWLVVGSTDRMDQSSHFSNGCGVSKYWCLTAQGTNVTSISHTGGYAERNGTSFSAPYVSGALALLRSRFPAMPMEVARAIVLASAEDLGAPGVDDVFGWGRLDAGRATALQNAMTIRVSGPGRLSANITLPAPAPLIPDRNFRTEEFGRQYGLNRIGADAAYRRGYFGQGATVAVVDTGMLTSHVELRDNVVDGEDFGDTLTVMTDPIASPFNTIGHGTFVGGIIGAALDGSGMHGVAPSASIMPMKISDRFGKLGGADAAILAAARRAHVINNSWSLALEMIGEYNGATYYVSPPIIGAFHHCPSGLPGSCPTPNIGLTLAAALQNRESVLVWAAGNSGWNATNGAIVLCADIESQVEQRVCPSGSVLVVRPEDFIREFAPIGAAHTATVSLTIAASGEEAVFVRTVMSPSYLVSANLASIPNITATSPGLYARAPIGHPELQDNWLVAVATDANDVIAFFSNGCGDAKFWCLAAPGVDIFASEGTSDNGFGQYPGTSFAAPHVSGALALLKSRFPHMPMDVIRAILLHTAKDLGDPGVDDIYGWGLVNMERAITLQGRFNIVTPERGFFVSLDASSAGVNLRNARIRLPSAFSHVESGLAGVSVAIGGIGNAHYNAPLSDFVEMRKSADVAHADAAADMLATDERRFQAGNLFAAADAKSGQFQYAGAFMDAGLLGEWIFRHDFCDGCIASVWPEWQMADAAKLSARQAAFQGYDAIEPALGGFEIMPSSLPFFARESGGASFMTSMQGEGLRPFAAAGEGDAPYRQYGLRWRKSLVGGLGLLAEASEVRESETFWGADFGSLGRASARTRHARLFAGGDLGEEWRGFGGYEASFGAAEAEGGALLQEVSGMRSSEWSAGLERRDVFSWGDALRARVSWRRVSGGEAVISHAVADEEECDFTCAFYGSLEDTPEYLVAGEQELESRESRVSLSSSASWSAALGYAFRVSRKSRASLGASHASEGTTTFSAAIRAEF